MSSQNSKVMNVRQILTAVAVMAIGVGSVMAQPVAKFAEKTHNFGIFDEEVGLVSCDFEIANTGSEPLVIKNVRTSCGCTASEYTQDPIAPKDKGNIRVTFNPTGRPGQFRKSIYVYTNTEPERTVLHITGEVVKGNHLASTQYAYQVGDLKLKSLHVPLSKVVKGRQSSGSIEVINAGSGVMIPKPESVPSHIRAKFVPDTLQRGEKGMLVVTFDPDAIDDWGYRRDEFKLENVVAEDGKKLEYNTISVSCTITEDFDRMSEQDKENAPILVVGEKNVDFKIIEGTKKVKREIYVVNAGRMPLVVHKIRNDNSIITAKLKKNKLAPGQSAKLVIEIDPMRARSNVMLSDIFIISNDPTNTSQPIRVTAEFR